jgi:hypothetical protein
MNKKIIILLSLLISGCSNDIVTVEKDIYDKQIK